MIGKIELLIIEISDRFIGIDCSEIKKVTSNISGEKEKALIKKYEEQKRYFRLGEIMNIRNKIDCNALIVIESSEGKDLLVSVPIISTILSTNISKVLAIPDYIRKKQDPFFVWGFIKEEAKIISLITFAFFNEKG